MGFHDVVFLPSRASFPPQFLKVVVEVRALGQRSMSLITPSHRHVVDPRLSPPPQFLKVVVEVKALGPPHVCGWG